MIDLHTHTNYSDGTWDVKKLLAEAEKAKIEVLAITDHDNVKAHLEIRENDYSKIFTGKIIRGVELNTVANNARVEFLAYDFDLDKINEWCNATYSNEFSENDLNIEFNEMIKSAEKNGVILDKIDYKPDMGWPIDYIFPEIKRHKENKKLFTEKEWNDIGYFFRCCTCNADFPIYYNMSNSVPNAKDVVKAVHNAGGKVFLAHLYQYPFRDYKKYLDDLIKDNLIDGIEVYHSSFTDYQINYLYNYCKENNILMSGGSDCHGDKKANRKIGVGFGNLCIDKQIISNWVKE